MIFFRPYHPDLKEAILRDPRNRKALILFDSYKRSTHGLNPSRRRFGVPVGMSRQEIFTQLTASNQEIIIASLCDLTVLIKEGEYKVVFFPSSFNPLLPSHFAVHSKVGEDVAALICLNFIRICTGR